MSVSILGIFFFQGYWLWNLYRAEKQELKRTVSSSFEQSVMETLAIHMADISRDTTAHALHGSMDIGITADSENQETPNTRYYREIHIDPPEGEAEHDTLTFTREYYHSTYDTIRMLGTTMLYEMVNTIRPIPLRKIDSIWDLHLKMKGIGSPHFVAAFSDEGKMTGSSVAAEPAGGQLIATQPFLASSREKKHLRGFVADTEQTVYSRMGLSILGSLLFVLITSACYIFLIRTILRQKTVAQIKNDFINNMTHELKTPITVTYSAIDALQTFHLADQKEKRETYFNLCKEQLKHLSELVEKILSMAVEERRNFKLRRESFLLQPVIRGWMEQLEVSSGKQINFSLDDHWGDRPVLADKFHLSQVIGNLLDNAVKYAGETVEITVRLQALPENILSVSVADNGPGIPAGQQSRIFERFYRIPQGNLHNVKGFGLGLSYAKDIVERHGGEITVSSNGKRGSIFTLKIPMKP